MAVISVRIDSEIDSLLCNLAVKKGMSKSDFIRILIVRGLDDEDKNNSEIINEIYELLLRNTSVTEKNFKAIAQILPLALRALHNISPDEIEAAKEDARKILEKNGVEA
jgi:antitoxin component of RelBE/YafQ-DinJ toxin-antitoxin module